MFCEARGRPVELGILHEKDRPKHPAEKWAIHTAATELLVV
jgi:hypothetical protein